MRASTSPIGLFDSGVGGLSVWCEIRRQLPHEATIYVADQAHVPYGPRSIAQIRGFSEAITDFLLDQGAKLIVVACNTASGAALHHLRATYPDVPFVGMEPAVKPAAEQSRSGVVGVIATPTTFQGELFQRLVDRFAHNVDIVSQVCPGLVEAVEAGELTTPATRTLLAQCLEPLLEVGIDQLVLGCTHYPFLRESIQALVGPTVSVIDPAPAVARQVGRVLERRGWLSAIDRSALHRIYTTGSPGSATPLIRKLINAPATVHRLVWGAPSRSLRVA